MQSYVEQERTQCQADMMLLVEEYREFVRLDYAYTKDFDLIRMGIWKYRNITWLRHYAGQSSKPIQWIEICEIFAHRADEVPDDIWALAEDISSKGNER